MDETCETRESLLIRVCDPQDQDAWDQFSRIYRPLVYKLARGRGMQDADAQDLAQKVLIAVAEAIPHWKRHTPQTRFRHWLRRVAKNAVLTAFARQPKDRAGGGTEALQVLSEQYEPDSVDQDEIDIEYRRQLFRRAAEIVRSRADETTWLAFSLTMVDGETVTEAASRIGRSEGVVYAARSRIMRRLRAVVRELEGE